MESRQPGHEPWPPANIGRALLRVRGGARAPRKAKVHSGDVHSMWSVLGRPFETVNWSVLFGLCGSPSASRSWRGNFARKKYECKRGHSGFAHIKAVIVFINGDAAGVVLVEVACWARTLDRGLRTLPRLLSTHCEVPHEVVFDEFVNRVSGHVGIRTRSRPRAGP